jgi:GNAT superfamily N-acetyltransferase
MNAAYLERVYVVPEMLGRRVGQALIERVIERARRDGRTKVWLQAMVEASAPLRRYHELGFTVCGSTTLVQPSVRADRAAMQILVKDLTDP